jgi:hypothetical protein
MKAERFDEFHRFGCNFYGKLVVVDYIEDINNDPKMGTFNAGVPFDYIDKAKKLVAEHQYKVVRELLDIPVYVVEVE